MQLRSRWTGALIAAAAVLVVASNAAQAQVKPFKVSGGGPAPLGLSIFGGDSPHSATGNATHMGKYSGDGVANVQTFDPATLGGTFKGFFTFVAANGDRLTFTYGDPDNGADQVGQYQLFDAGGGKVFAVFIAEFNPVVGSGTGRFKDVVDGSFIMVAVSEPFALTIDANGYSPPFNYTWEGKGWIEFRKGK